jgi:hypothetical protein
MSNAFYNAVVSAITFVYLAGVELAHPGYSVRATGTSRSWTMADNRQQ